MTASSNLFAGHALQYSLTVTFGQLYALASI